MNVDVLLLQVGQQTILDRRTDPSPNAQVATSIHLWAGSSSSVVSEERARDGEKRRAADLSRDMDVAAKLSEKNDPARG